MLVHVPSFDRNPRGSPDFLAYPVPKACMHVLGTRVSRRSGVARSASSPKAAQALGCSLTPGLRISFGRVTCMARAASVPGCGHWVSYCCAAFVIGSGWRLGVGFVNPASPGWGLGWVCFGTVCGVVPLVSAVCGVRGWASVSACLWDVCGFVGAPNAPRRFRFRRAVWACVLGPGPGCAKPFLARLSGGVFFFALFFSSGLCGPCPSIPFLSGWAGGSLFFFFPFRCPFSRWAAVPGLVLPVFGWVVPLCLFGGPVFGAFWGGGLAASGGVGGRFGGCGLFSRLFPLPLLFLGGGGLVCSSLCLPWAGARTGLHSVLSPGLLFSVAFCLAAFRPHGLDGLCTRWARRPFLPG